MTKSLWSLEVCLFWLPELYNLWEFGTDWMVLIRSDPLEQIGEGHLISTFTCASHLIFIPEFFFFCCHLDSKRRPPNCGAEMKTTCPLRPPWLSIFYGGGGARVDRVWVLGWNKWVISYSYNTFKYRYVCYCFESSNSIFPRSILICIENKNNIFKIQKKSIILLK